MLYVESDDRIVSLHLDLAWVIHALVGGLGQNALVPPFYVRRGLNKESALAILVQASTAGLDSQSLLDLLQATLRAQLGGLVKVLSMLIEGQNTRTSLLGKGGSLGIEVRVL